MTMEQLAVEIAARDAAWPVLPLILADMASGRIIHVSQHAADIFGYEVEELLDQPVEILLPESLRDMHARWRQDATVPKTRLMGVGRQLAARRKDGTVFPVHIGLTATRFNGHQVGIAFVIDLTGIVALAGGMASHGT